jgi:hypothetical protein
MTEEELELVEKEAMQEADRALIELGEELELIKQEADRALIEQEAISLLFGQQSGC